MLVAPLLLVELTIVQFFVHVDEIFPTPPPEGLVSADPLLTFALAFRLINATLGCTCNSSDITSSPLGIPPSRSAQYAVGLYKKSKKTKNNDFVMEDSTQDLLRQSVVLSLAAISAPNAIDKTTKKPI